MTKREQARRVPSGEMLGLKLLQSVRVAQLDGIVATPEAATELALRLAGRLDDPPAAT